jgi:hypothetical protein
MPPRVNSRQVFVSSSLARREAAIRGIVGTKSIGVFSYEKRLEEISGTVPCEVRVFSMFV